MNIWKNPKTVKYERINRGDSIIIIIINFKLRLIHISVYYCIFDEYFYFDIKS